MSASLSYTDLLWQSQSSSTTMWSKVTRSSIWPCTLLHREGGTLITLSPSIFRKCSDHNVTIWVEKLMSDHQNVCVHTYASTWYCAHHIALRENRKLLPASRNISSAYSLDDWVDLCLLASPLLTAISVTLAICQLQLDCAWSHFLFSPWRSDANSLRCLHYAIRQFIQ